MTRTDKTTECMTKAWVLVGQMQDDDQTIDMQIVNEQTVALLHAADAIITELTELRIIMEEVKDNTRKQPFVGPG